MQSLHRVKVNITNMEKDLEFARQICRLLNLGSVYANGNGTYTLQTHLRRHRFRTLEALTNYCIHAIEAVPRVMQGEQDVRRKYLEAKWSYAASRGRRNVTLVSAM